MHDCRMCGDTATLRLSRMGGWSCIRCALSQHKRPLVLSDDRMTARTADPLLRDTVRYRVINTVAAVGLN